MVLNSKFWIHISHIIGLEALHTKTVYFTTFAYMVGAESAKIIGSYHVKTWDFNIYFYAVRDSTNMVSL